MIFRISLFEKSNIVCTSQKLVVYGYFICTYTALNYFGNLRIYKLIPFNPLFEICMKPPIKYHRLGSANSCKETSCVCLTVGNWRTNVKYL